MQKVALIGLGTMGIGMGGRLLGAGFPLTVFNRTPERAAELVKQGARLASSPAEAAADANIVFAMVSDDKVSREIWLGEKGALKSAKPGTVCVDCSTLSPVWTRELAAEAQKHGCEFLDAPVTGTKPHAASGELVFLVGGSQEALDAARPVFSVLGRDVLHLGTVGSGARMKLINNFVCGVQAASFAEALTMIDAGVLDRATAISVLTGGAPGSGIVKRIADRMATNDFTPNFALHWMAKDLSYALRNAADKGIQLQTAAAALSVFQQAIAEGHGNEDFSAVSKTAARRSNS